MSNLIVIMGVTGVGKTTIGSALARELGFAFEDADQYHPPANIEKMSQGIPLTDADRIPWLKALHRVLLDYAHRQQGVVLACSALRESYRDILRSDIDIQWVFLKGSPEAIRKRIQHRAGHFAHEDLLASQIATLEEPKGAMVVDADGTEAEVLNAVMARLRP
jgi:gluconokinase